MSESISLRDYIGTSLARIDNAHICVLDGDLSKSTRSSDFKTAHPDRFIECGISETSAMGMAIGLAAEGMVPFVVSFCLFAIGSAWTQLRMACYANANIKIIGSHPGIDNGLDGASHHSCEDLALARALPNLKVFSPATLDQLEGCLALAAGIPGPVYIRVPRDKVVDYVSKNPVSLGKSDIVEDLGDDFAIVFEGSTSKVAFEAFNQLKLEGYHGKLVNILAIKPLDTGLFESLGQKVRTIVSVENHSTIGGCASAIAQVLAANGKHAPLRTVGIPDEFSMSASAGELKQHFGITAQQVVALSRPCGS